MYFTGTEICYPVLDQNSRFKDGLGKIAKSIVERLSAPRIVTVAGESRELNATNAESIIATIIRGKQRENRPGEFTISLSLSMNTKI